MKLLKYTETLSSECLHKDVMIGFVLPGKIENIMILLHGFGGSFQVLDEILPLKDYAESNNMLIAMPNLGDGYYLDHEDYSVSKFVAEELPNYLKTNFDLPDAYGKILAGISMGGYGCMLIGAKYPHAFDTLISISGAFIANDVAIGNPQVTGNPGNMTIYSYFKETFGDFASLESDPLRNPEAAICACAKNHILPRLMISCGTEDPLYRNNIEFIHRLKEAKIRYDWFPVLGGQHDRVCGHTALTEFLGKL